MKKRIRIISILIALCFLLCSCDRSEYKKALSMMNSGNYEEAIVIFEKIKEYEDSREKIEECEAAIIEKTYLSAISLVDEGKYKDASIIFEELGRYKESNIYLIACNEQLCEEEYLDAKELADSGNPEAYDALKAFEDNYYQKVLLPYLEIRDEGNPTDETFIEFMKDKIAYEYYNDVDKEIAYVLAKHPELAQKGDHYFFGSYEQDNNLENGKEPIEWTIVNKKDGKLKLYSEYILDSIPYHSENEEVSWEKCTLRQWLNETFYSEAFTENEQQKILITNNEAYKVVIDRNGHKRYLDTTIEDYIFLDALGGDKGDEQTSKSEATLYAKERGIEEVYGGFAYWMMQKKSTHWGIYWRPEGQKSFMKIVEANGAKVNEEGFGVRPMMWIEVEGVTGEPIEEEQDSKKTFTNKYGTETTKCIQKTCNNYIATSGDTNACKEHSNKCLNCNCYIDGDAMYCMSCLSGSVGNSTSK